MLVAATTLPVDDYDLGEFGRLAANFGVARFGYVVTPNVDQIIRYYDSMDFRAAYADAAYVLLDSRFLAHCLALLQGRRLRVCTGSDLTAWILQHAVGHDDRVILVGASVQQAQRLSSEFTLTNLVHVNPPMGFVDRPEQVEQCLQAIEAAAPFRYCFLAVGSPQQELLAQALKSRCRARGLALCVGASVNFLTGAERRAPAFMQRMGLEWLFRLLSSPRRMAQRYLVRGPRIFILLRRLQLATRRSELVPALRR